MNSSEEQLRSLVQRAEQLERRARRRAVVYYSILIILAGLLLSVMVWRTQEVNEQQRHKDQEIARLMEQIDKLKNQPRPSLVLQANPIDLRYKMGEITAEEAYEELFALVQEETGNETTKLTIKFNLLSTNTLSIVNVEGRVLDDIPTLKQDEKLVVEISNISYEKPSWSFSFGPILLEQIPPSGELPLRFERVIPTTVSGTFQLQFFDDSGGTSYDAANQVIFIRIQ